MLELNVEEGLQKRVTPSAPTVTGSSAEAELDAAGLGPLPNAASLARQAADWEMLVVRDPTPPAAAAKTAQSVVAASAAGHSGPARRQLQLEVAAVRGGSRGRCWPCEVQPQWPNGPLVRRWGGDGCGCAPAPAMPRF